jgi:hypothetical protein
MAQENDAISLIIMLLLFDIFVIAHLIYRLIRSETPTSMKSSYRPSTTSGTTIINAGRRNGRHNGVNHARPGVNGRGNELVHAGCGGNGVVHAGRSGDGVVHAGQGNDGVVHWARRLEPLS